jgi:diguanylate cyclase (GGDEF)-like protein/PAS domain S-box-containing protein
VEAARITAQALLVTEYDVLLQGMNESLNHSLAIAEFPSVVQYLSNAQETQSPYQERLLKQNRDQFGAMFNSLLTHFGRYTRLALINTNGNEHFPTQSSTLPAADPAHADALYFREAMTLKTRSLYVSPPYLGPAATGPEITTAVVDITAPCGYHSLNERGVILKINRAELQWLGYSADELIGKQLYRELVTSETRDAFDEAFREVLGGSHEGSAECELMCRDGSTIPVAIEATAQTTSDGFQYSRAMVFDLTERKQLEDQLTRQAMTDPLTGLGNRRYLENQADMEMARARRNGEPLSLISIDLDRFKRINDHHGHDVGDLVLQAFAQTTQEQLRDGDVLCRMGGEEFTVLLPGTNMEQAGMIAERLRQAVEATPVDIGADPVDGGPLAYTASLGVTAVHPEESSLKPAIKRADQQLYEAKETGRNRVISTVDRRLTEFRPNTSPSQ